MRRFLQVLTLGAATLLFTTAGPGIAAADKGRGGGHVKNAPIDMPLYKAHKAHKAHKKYGKDRRHGKRHVGEKRRRQHAREHRRDHRHAHARHYRKHRHFGHRHRGRWHRRYGHRHYHGVWPYIGLHFYRSYGHAAHHADPPAADLGPPPAYRVQPATTEQKVAATGHPSTCLMTREYQTEILVGGELVPAYGQACLQPDGSWYRGPAVPEHN